jgi:hypothetical protein
MGLSPFPKKSEPEVVSPPVLSLAILCTNEVVKAGDEISVEFRITNRGTNDYKYEDRNYDRSGRMGEYKLVAKNESGETVPDPRANSAGFWMMGGIFQYAILKPGQSFTKIIPLNRWALVKEPGRYTVVGTNFVYSYSTNVITISSDPITITVLPRTAKEMDAYINDLTNQIAAIPPVRFITSTQMPENVRATNSVTDPKLSNLVIKLMYTCSPKIVPALLNTMYEPASGGFWESEALLFYVPHSGEVKQAIIVIASQHGLANGMVRVLSEYGCTNREDLQALIERSLAPDNPQSWIAGALAAQQYADDSFTPRLIALATEPQNVARTQAIYALAANRTDEGVKTLKALLNDPDLTIRKATKDAIRTAYDGRGIWQGRPLKPEDFDAKFREVK